MQEQSHDADEHDDGDSPVARDEVKGFEHPDEDVDEPLKRAEPAKPAGEDERLVEFAWQPRDTSRLACQIRMTDALDGLVLYIPERQL